MANSSFSGVKPEPACPVHLFCFQTQCTEHQLHLYITKAKGECKRWRNGWCWLVPFRDMVDQICNTRNIWIHICQKIKKNKKKSCSTNQYLLPFPEWFQVYPKKTQFRVIIPESVTSLGGGEEPKNVPSNFGVLQFYIILALALLTILSENFGFSVRRRLSWEMLPK